jgi:hypothetical protein
MKRVTLVSYDYDPIDRSEWTESRPAILINDYTLITKDDDYLDVYRSKSPIEVTDDDCVIYRGFPGAEIHLNQSAKTLDISKFATMTVAQFTNYLLIERGN